MKPLDVATWSRVHRLAEAACAAASAAAAAPARSLQSAADRATLLACGYTAAQAATIVGILDRLPDRALPGSGPLLRSVHRPSAEAAGRRELRSHCGK